MPTPTIITAQKLWDQLRSRGIHLSVQCVREGNHTQWPRIWMKGGKQYPGDFETIARVKPELVALLEGNDAHTEGTTLDNCDYALTRGFAPPLPLPPSSLLEEFDLQPTAPTRTASLHRRLPYGNKGRPRTAPFSPSHLFTPHSRN